MGNWETGFRTPKTSKLGEIANFFGVTIDYLLGNMDQYTPSAADDTPELYLELLRNAKRLKLDQHDIDILLDVAKRLKE